MTILNLKIKVLKTQHFYVVSFLFERKNFMIKSDKFKLFQPADCTPKSVTIHFLPNEDYVLTYTSQYLDKPIKSNTPKILWIRPEDNLLSLFKRATLYFQQQRVWNSEDYATAIRNLFPYYSYDGSTITVEYSQLNSCFLTGIEKNEMIKKFNLKGVKRIFKMPTADGELYFVLQSKQVSKLEGNIQEIQGTQFIFVDHDRVIGEEIILHQFIDFLESKLNEMHTVPMDGFDTAIDVVRDMLCKGLINGSRTMKHQNYSSLQVSVDALEDKRTKDFLDLGKWDSFDKVKAYCYKLFARFLVTRFHHTVDYNSPTGSEYRGLAGSIYYVLDVGMATVPNKGRKHIIVNKGGKLVLITNPSPDELQA